MAERIYIKNTKGELDSLEETPFPLEDDLQALLAEHPELLDGKQIRPDDPRRWILIKREKGIAETSGAGDRFALDHLLIDQDAIPTLVEVKRGSNTEVRRKVVGQMLEYAALATGGAGSWAVDDIRRDFEGRTDAPDAALRGLLGEDQDAGEFWEAVRINLAARRIRLLFVADEIPDSLARIVAFLNEQTRDNIEVLAVEIKQFSDQTTQTLVPRVIGRTAARPTEGNLTRESFLAGLGSSMALAAARLLDTALKAKASLTWGAASVSIRGHCPLWKDPISVGWLSPPRKTGWLGTKSFQFGWGGPSYGYPFEIEQRLSAWTEQFRDDDFAEAVGDKGLSWAMTPEDAAEHIDVLTDRLAAVLSDLKSLGADSKGA